MRYIGAAAILAVVLFLILAGLGRMSYARRPSETDFLAETEEDESLTESFSDEGDGFSADDKGYYGRENIEAGDNGIIGDAGDSEPSGRVGSASSGGAGAAENGITAVDKGDSATEKTDSSSDGGASGSDYPIQANGEAGASHSPQNSAVSDRSEDYLYDLFVDTDGDGSYDATYSGLTKGAEIKISSAAGDDFRKWEVKSGQCTVSKASSKTATVTIGYSDAYIVALLLEAKAPSYDTCSFCITCKPFYDGSQKEVRDNLPKEGAILNATAVEIKDGDSVYDVLKRVCADKGIQYTAQETMYGIYVSSIDNLSEKYYDASAGWCYTVNGEYPSVSSSEIRVKPGDAIQWIYDVWTF